MISGVLLFNQKGENLIFRQFRNDCTFPLQPLPPSPDNSC